MTLKSKKDYLKQWFNQGIEILIAPCSNSCGHCYTNAKIGADSVMTMDNFTKSLKFFAHLKERFSIETEDEYIPLFIYQELFLNTDWYKLFEISKEYGFIPTDKFMLTTNGSVIAECSVDQRFVSDFRKFAPYNIQLVFHGKEENHDKFSARKGAYRDIIKAAEFARKEEVNLTWQYFFTRNNISDFPEIFDLMSELSRSEDIELRLMIGNYGGRMIKNNNTRPRRTDFEILPEKYYSKVKEQGLIERTYTEKEFLEKLDEAQILNPPYIMPPLVFPDLTLYSDWDTRRVIGNLLDNNSEDHLFHNQEKMLKFYRNLAQSDIKSLFAKYADIKDQGLHSRNSATTKILAEISKGECWEML